MGAVLVAGNVVWDTLVGPIEELRWGRSTWVETFAPGLGGNGGSTAYALGRLGGRVTLASAVGEDEAGRQALAVLEGARVETRLVERLALGTASTMAVFRANGERALVHHPGASLRALDGFSPAAHPGFGHFHLANPYSTLAFRTQAAGMLRAAKGAGMTVSMDTGWDSKGGWMEVIAGGLESVDLLFTNEVEALELTGEATAEAAIARFPVANCCVKLGPAGCLLRSEGELVRVPGFAVEAVDTTGAGDIFCGAFLAALGRGYGLREAARWANAAGAMSVRRPGATAGLGTWEELAAMVASQAVSADWAGENEPK